MTPRTIARDVDGMVTDGDAYLVSTVFCPIRCHPIIRHDVSRDGGHRKGQQ
jgi:hypothetical protein